MKKLTVDVGDDGRIVFELTEDDRVVGGGPANTPFERNWLTDELEKLFSYADPS